MRWPFRRRDGGRPDGGGASTGGGAPAAPPAPPRPRSDWATLPALRATVSTQPPLVAVAPLAPPQISGNRSLIQRPVPRIDPADAPRGRAEGLTSVLPANPGPEPPTAPPVVVSRPPVPPPGADQPRPHVAGRPLVGRPALTQATAEFVGEPQVPAEPYRAPSWLRTTMPVEDAGPLGFLPPLPAPPQPRRPAPPPITAIAPSTTAPEPARRLNLADSRRVGLGTPIVRSPGTPFIPPRPAPAAPPPAAEERSHSSDEYAEAAEIAARLGLPIPPGLVPPAAPARPLGPVPRWQPTEAEPDPPGPGEAGPAAEPPALVHRPLPARRTRDDEDDEQPPPAPVEVVEQRDAPPEPPSPPPGGGIAPAPPPVPALPAGAVTVEGPVARAEPVPLVYRGRPFDPHRAERPAAQPVRRIVQQVPADLAHAVRASHGVDVSAVPIHRGPAVSQQARSLGARAFTRGRQVFLPDEAGPLDSAEARSLVAHELTHVVQQHVLGSAVPHVSSSGGAHLEAQAQAAEVAVRAGAGLPTLVHPPRPSPVVIAPTEEPADGPVQLAASAPTATSGQTHGQTQQRDYSRDPLSAHEFGQMFANAPLEWISGRYGINADGPDGSGGGGGGGGSGGGGPVGDFDREQRRMALEQERVDELNAVNDQTGQPHISVSDLTDNDRRLIQDRLDHEAAAHAQRQAAGSGGGPGGSGGGPGGGPGGGGAGGRGTGGGGGQQARDYSRNPLRLSEFGAMFENAPAEFFSNMYGIELPTESSSSASQNGHGGAGGGGAAGGGAGAGGAAGGDAGRHGADAARHGAGQDGSHYDHRQTGPSGRPLIDPDDMDLDELAGRLYDRLRSKLRTELLVDRERAGLLTDFR